MTVLVIAPGAAYCTRDVFDGLCAGLSSAGVNVATYSLHGRLAVANNTQHAAWRLRKKTDRASPRPTVHDIAYESCLGIFEKCYRFDPDVVLFVSGVLITAETFQLLRKRHTVGVLLTESPYLMEHEQRIAAHVDLVWTHERAAVPLLRQVQPRTEYLPHAWLPGRHDAVSSSPDLPEHDVVFVGTDFPERIALLEAVDWTGIDLGLYGNWGSLRADSPLKPCVRQTQIDNATTAALYRRAKIGLNLYRTSTDFSGRPLTLPAHSLNPRAYELAAAGVFTLSTPRAELAERFGDRVPTFTTAAELQALLSRWLADDAGRAAVAAQLPACVAEDTWLTRGRQLVAHLRDSARAA